MDVLQKGTPDCEYEYFWYIFKDSVTNMANAHPGSQHLQAFAQEVPLLSSCLNRLQTDGRYDEIVEHIAGFLFRYGWALVEFHVRSDVGDLQRLSIGHTNLKRWLRLRPDSPGLQFLMQITDMLTGRYETDIRETLRTTESVQDQDLVVTTLIQRALENRQNAVIVTLCENYRDTFMKHVSAHYGITLPKDIKDAQKILKILEKGQKPKTL